MFGRKRRKVQNDAAMVLDSGEARAAISRPQNVTYDNRTNYWPMVFAVMVLLPLIPWLVWRMGVSLFMATGMRQVKAELAMANTVFAIAVIVLIVVVLAVIARLFLTGFFAHRERMRQLDLDALQLHLEAARYQQLTAQAQPVATNGRLMDEDKRWCQIIIAVMFKAFDHYAANGEFTGVARPWSRRTVQAIQLRDGSAPTEAEAGRVRGWLTEQGVVKHDQINIARYPDLAAVQELLNRLYHIPLQISAGGNSALLRTNEGYEHI